MSFVVRIFHEYPILNIECPIMKLKKQNSEFENLPQNLRLSALIPRFHSGRRLRLELVVSC